MFIVFRFRGVAAAFFSIAEAVTEADGVRGTSADAHAATDAFRVIRRFCYIHIHLAGLCAFSAGNTLVLIHLHSEKRYLVKKRIKCP